MTKFALLACVYSGVPRVNRGETGKTWVDTPESGFTVCLVFCREVKSNNLKFV